MLMMLNDSLIDPLQQEMIGFIQIIIKIKIMRKKL